MSRTILARQADQQIRSFLAPLMPYFDGDDTNEIMVNRDDAIFIERAGQTQRLEGVSISSSNVIGAMNAIASRNDKSADVLVDARLAGMRVAACRPPVAVHGPLLSIRKLVTVPQTFGDYLGRGDFDPDNMHAVATARNANERGEMERAAAQGGEGLAEFFRWLMHTRRNTVIAGGTSSGKTTLAGAFLESIPDAHRIITCEDTHELVLRQPNVVQLESAPDSGVDLRRLVKMCLRLRPDRIIVGEVRGPELFDILDAANTGHPGTLFTIHADSAKLALLRMETLLRMARELADVRTRELRERIATSIDYVVFQARSGLRRAPVEVIAVEPDLASDDGYRTRTVYSIFHPDLSIQPRNLEGASS